MWAVVRALVARALVLAVGLVVLPDAARAVANRAYVQKRYFQVTSGNSVSVILRRPDTAGNLLVAFVVWDNGDAVSLTDTRDNTWASAVGPTSAGGTHAQIFYASDIAAGLDTVTATFATAITVRGALYVVEYTGIDRTSPLAGAVAASGSSPAMDSGPLAVAAAKSLLIVGGASNRAVKRQTRGYRARARKYGNLVAEQVAPSPGSYDVTATH